MPREVIELARLEMMPRIMSVHGQPEEIEMAAFVGATCGTVASLGLGLVDHDGNRYLWSQATPHALIACWRGMFILDALSQIHSDTIPKTYRIVQRRESALLNEALADLKWQLPNIADLRAEFLNMKIPDGELDRMLIICNDPSNNIDVSISELKEELALGIINETEQLKRAFEIDAACRARQEAINARCKDPLPADQSFRKFCDDAGIRYLCDAPLGCYGPDWSHRNLKTLDENIVRVGLSYHNAFDIICTEYLPRPNKLSNVFGHIGTPVLRLKNGVELILRTAHYHDDEMWVTTSHVGHTDRQTEWILSDLAAHKPRMVGLTYDFSSKPTFHRRSYYHIKDQSQPSRLTQLLQKFKK